MTPEVLFQVLRKKVDSLPPQALGIRCHCIPTEGDFLTVVVGACERLVASGSAALARCEVVIGSPTVSPNPLPSRLTVLPPHAAAAEATRLRSAATMESGQGLAVIYLNVSSTPGEAGLHDTLVELTPSEVANVFAEVSRLPVLAELSRAPLRSLRARLEDAGVLALGHYAHQALRNGEQYALPILGFVPDREDSRVPSQRWATVLDSLGGLKTSNKLREAAEALKALRGADRDRVQQALRGTIAGASASADLVRLAAQLSDRAARFASGRGDEPAELAGLTGGLVRILKRGKSRIEQLAAAPPRDGDTGETGGDEDEDSDVEGGSPLSEEAALARLGPDAFQVGVEGMTLQQGRLTLKPSAPAPTGVEITADAGSFSPRLLQRHCARIIDGWALRVGSRDLLLSDGPHDPLAEIDPQTIAEAVTPPPKIEDAGDLAPQLEQFFEARHAFLACLTETAVHATEAQEESNPASEPPAPSLLGLLLLARFPLVAVGAHRAAAVRYLEAYCALCACSEVGSAELRRWLTNLDMAFLAKDDGRVDVARFLPPHPLRVARAALWITSGAEPPQFPAAVTVHWRHWPEPLTPEGRPERFHTEQHVRSASTKALRAAARIGLGNLWTLLFQGGYREDDSCAAPVGPRAISVEIRETPDSYPLIEALCAELEELYDQHSEGPCSVLMHVTRSSGSTRTEHGSLDLGRLGPLSKELRARDAALGPSLRVDVEDTPGASARHIIIQTVPTHVEQLPPSTPACAGVRFVPHPQGNVAAIDPIQCPALGAYRTLLRRENVRDELSIRPESTRPDVARAVVHVLVARGGWPVDPARVDDSLLSYDFVDGHAIVVLGRPNVLSRLLRSRLADLPGQLTPEVVRRAAIGMHVCRGLLPRVLGDSFSESHLRGELALARAFDTLSLMVGAGEAALLISLDSPEARAWAALHPSAQRADFLVVVADAQLQRVERLRVVELKARARSSALRTESQLKSHSLQARLTAARVQACYTPGAELRLIDGLRRLIWLGAGRQRLAHRWRHVLFDLDRTLRDRCQVPIEVECWAITDDPWPDEGVFTREIAEAPPWRVGFRIISPASSGDGASTAPLAPGPDAPVGPARGISGPGTHVSPRGSSPREGTDHCAPDNPRTEFGARTSSTTSSALKDRVPPPEEVAPTDNPAGAGPAASTDVLGTASPVGVPSPPETTGAANSPKPPLTRPSKASRLVVDLGAAVQSGERVSWRPGESRVTNAFFMILGASGSGKTTAIQTIVHDLATHGYPVLVIDFHGDLDVGGEVIEFTGDPRARIGINPLELESLEPASGGPNDHATKVCERLTRATSNAIKHVQKKVLRDAILRCYAGAGIRYEDPDTWGRLPPTFGHLRETLEEMADDQAISKNERERAPTVSTALDSIFGHPVFQQTSFVPIQSLFQGLTRLRLKMLPQSMQFLVADTVLRKVFGVARLMGEIPRRPAGDHERYRLFLVVDEAKVLALGAEPEDHDAILNLLATEARKFGIGLVVASQLSDHFGKDLRANADTWLVMRAGERSEAKRNAETIGVRPEELLSLEGKGYGFLRMGGGARALHVRVKPPWDKP